MPFGSLTAAQRILVELYMKGGPQYKKQMIEAGLATGILTKEQEKLALAQAKVTKRSWLMNQALFTARRFLFYTTLGTLALGAAVIALGFQYDSAMQQARVALTGVITPQRRLSTELAALYRIAALTPFVFKDVTIAFRTLYAGFKPLGISLDTTNQTIQAITDALSYAGKVTPAALNRVSTALLHMAYMGRPAGQTIIQLARDGLPIYSALHKELGLTDDQMKNIGGSGITALQVIQALNRYIETTPGFMHAALKQANKTLYGSWTTFKDLLSQAAGTGERGLFGAIHKTLSGVNNQLAQFYKRGKPITLTNVADAFDKQLTPGTHAVINTFNILEGVLNGVVGTFYAFYTVVNILLTPLRLVEKATGNNVKVFRILGYALGVMVGLWLLNAGAGLIAALAVDAFRFSLLVLRPIIWLTSLALTIMGLDFEALALQALYAADAMQVFAVSMLTNPVGWILLIVGILVILYFRWKRFHDLVNKTATYIWHHKVLLLALLGPVTLIYGLFLKWSGAWDKLISAIEWVIKKIKALYEWLQKIKHFLESFFWGPGGTANVAPVFGQGVIQSAGRGARSALPHGSGVDIVGGANLIPQNNNVASVANYIQQGENTTTVNLVVDRQVLAKAVARSKADRAARR